MLDSMRHWHSIGRMRRQKAATQRHFLKKIQAAKKAGATSDKIYDIESEEHYELTMTDDEIGIAESRRLTKQAAHYRVPVPQSEDDWEDSGPFGTRFLTRAGASKLRADIRIEQKARWDWWQSRVSMVGSVMGIVGGLMGAVAYFKPPLPPHP